MPAHVPLVAYAIARWLRLREYASGIVPNISTSRCITSSQPENPLDSSTFLLYSLLGVLLFFCVAFLVTILRPYFVRRGPESQSRGHAVASSSSHASAPASQAAASSVPRATSPPRVNLAPAKKFLRRAVALATPYLPRAGSPSLPDSSEPRVPGHIGRTLLHKRTIHAVTKRFQSAANNPGDSTMATYRSFEDVGCGDTLSEPSALVSTRQDPQAGDIYLHVPTRRADAGDATLWVWTEDSDWVHAHPGFSHPTRHEYVLDLSRNLEVTWAPKAT
ncbi:hypothetical protein EIP91_005495 [Steccherinum ochraceum]|uniref:Uncharacterized protein n=1 Tax=Steccherinum ochraceum TaxID=92696 RepID=A0A4R0RZ72_9APHY|nr:hypothetical protein EIP91_005495 [Steccherinum ochraceum]